ncbi:hypothetical protein A6R68_23216, partial [Neotoma lepida]
GPDLFKKHVIFGSDNSLAFVLICAFPNFPGQQRFWLSAFSTSGARGSSDRQEDCGLPDLETVSAVESEEARKKESPKGYCSLTGSEVTRHHASFSLNNLINMMLKSNSLDRRADGIFMIQSYELRSSIIHKHPETQKTMMEIFTGNDEGEKDTESRKGHNHSPAPSSKRRNTSSPCRTSLSSKNRPCRMREKVNTSLRCSCLLLCNVSVKPGHKLLPTPVNKVKMTSVPFPNDEKDKPRYALQNPQKSKRLNTSPSEKHPHTMNNDSDQVIHAVQIHSIAGGVEEPELQREDHPALGTRPYWSDPVSSSTLQALGTRPHYLEMNFFGGMTPTFFFCVAMLWKSFYVSPISPDKSTAVAKSTDFLKACFSQEVFLLRGQRHHGTTSDASQALFYQKQLDARTADQGRALQRAALDRASPLPDPATNPPFVIHLPFGALKWASTFLFYL